jgi:peptidyl-prolyl cis-trans isomerase D
MITFMRRYRVLLQIGLVVIVVVFIASSFIFGWRSFDGSGGGDRVATVNGESISRKQYQDRYQQVLDYYAQVNRGRLTPEMAEQLGLSQRVVEDLVTEAVVVQRAQAEGLGLDDEEFNAAVHSMREFQDNGRFSMDRYQRFLQVRGVDAEQDLRRYLTVRKVQRLVAGGARVTDAELEQAWQTRHEQVRAAWAVVEAGPLAAAVTVSDAEAAEYLAAHGDEFKQPERRRVQYVTLVAKDFTPKVSDADVEKYYTEHPKEFSTPHQVHASHVLARVGETGGSEAEDKARAKIVDVIRRAKAGEDFAKLARENSEDPGSRDKGGDLGWVNKGDMVPAFEQPLFALKKGELTPEPVRTPFGYHAIKVTDVREGASKPLKDVAAQIRDRLAADAADKAARAKADETRPALQQAKDFMAQARALGLAPLETTMTKVGRPPGLPPGVGPDTLEEAAFALALGGVTEPVKTPTGWVLLKAIDAIPAGVPPLAEIHDRVVAVVKRQKADVLAAGRAKQLADDARSGPLEAAARKDGAAYGETPRFSRAKPAEKLPGDAQLVALQTPTGETSPPVRTPQGYYIVKVLERVPAGPVDPLERDKLEKELVTQKQNQIWERWVLAARGDARIDVVGQRPARRG